MSVRSSFDFATARGLVELLMHGALFIEFHV